MSSNALRHRLIRMFTLPVCAVVLPNSAAHAQAVYDVEAEFSTAVNPNGVWSYGRRTVPEDTSLTLSERTSTSFIGTAGLSAWYSAPVSATLNWSPSQEILEEEKDE